MITGRHDPCTPAGHLRKGEFKMKKMIAMLLALSLLLALCACGHDLGETNAPMKRLDAAQRTAFLDGLKKLGYPEKFR